MITAKLRLLQTTDIHMQMLGHDYATNDEADRTGFVDLLPVIAQARDGHTALLFDTGDFLQGNPLADLIANDPTRSTTHPMIGAFNDLAYDAITLGNHEFDFGLPYLRRALDGCTMPVVCANARTSPTRDFVQPWTILTRDLECSDGSVQTLRIGVIGFVTPPVTDWNTHVLHDVLQSDDILAAARSHLPALRRAGADIVVALCHGGIAPDPVTERMENPALPLAAVPGIDVVLAGHTHDCFPGPDLAGIAHADAHAGTLHGKPGVMAGAFGAALGVIDLTLQNGPDGWFIDDHTSTVLKAQPRAQPTPEQTRFRATLAPDHAATIALLHQPVCTTPRRLTSYFTCLGRDTTAPLIAAAMTTKLTEALASTALSGLPVLATTSPYRAGGHGGPRNFTDVAPGPVTRSHVAGIVPFNNPITGVLRRGWQVRQWLEATSHYLNTLSPAIPDQPLINAQVPAYRFDTIHGLRYRIDLSVPPRAPDDQSRPARIRDVTFQGAPLQDDALFVVATTSYRAHGGGGVGAIPTQDIIYRSDVGLTDLLIDCLQSHPLPAADPEPGWSLRPLTGTTATFAIGPAGLTALPPGIALQPVTDTLDAQGFVQMRLTL